MSEKGTQMASHLIFIDFNQAPPKVSNLIEQFSFHRGKAKLAILSILMLGKFQYVLLQWDQTSLLCMSTQGCDPFKAVRFPSGKKDMEAHAAYHCFPMHSLPGSKSHQTG